MKGVEGAGKRPKGHEWGWSWKKVAETYKEVRWVGKELKVIKRLKGLRG